MSEQVFLKKKNGKISQDSVSSTFTNGGTVYVPLQQNNDKIGQPTKEGEIYIGDVLVGKGLRNIQDATDSQKGGDAQGSIILNDIENNIAAGKNAVAMGSNNIAAGFWSFAMGYNNTTLGPKTLVGGEDSKSENYDSIAFGKGVLTKEQEHQFPSNVDIPKVAFGRYNYDTSGDKEYTDHRANEPGKTSARWENVFTIGNGKSDTDRSNLTRITEDADGDADQYWVATGADGDEFENHIGQYDISDATPSDDGGGWRHYIEKPDGSITEAIHYIDEEYVRHFDAGTGADPPTLLFRSDVVDNLVSTDSTSPLSANMGRVLDLKIPKYLKDAPVDNGSVVINSVASHNVTGANSTAVGVNNSISGDNSFAGGSDNSISGDNSFSSGVRNESNGDVSITFGSDNVNDGNYSGIQGYKNVIASGSQNCFIEGQEGYLKSNNHFVSGYQNTVDYDMSNGVDGGATFGRLNKVTWRSNLVTGHSNTVNCRNSLVSGDRNQINTRECDSVFIAGGLNTVTGTIKNAVVTGSYNVLNTINSGFNTQSSFVGGFQNTCTILDDKTANFVFGRGLKSRTHEGQKSWGQFIVGQFNAGGTSNCVFEVGYGQSESTRKTALIIDSNGDVWIKAKSSGSLINLSGKY